MIQMCYAPAILTDTGTMVEWVKYSAYGVPYSLPAPPPGDQVTDSDGDWDATDDSAISGSGSYDVRQDADLNGKVESDDITHANSITGGYQTLGRWLLGADIIGNRRGYAGYEFDPTFVGNKRSLYHVRHRVYDAGLGRWTRRDPLGYVDGMGLYEYIAGRPNVSRDSHGTYSRSCNAINASSMQVPPHIYSSKLPPQCRLHPNPFDIPRMVPPTDPFEPYDLEPVVEPMTRLPYSPTVRLVECNDICGYSLKSLSVSEWRFVSIRGACNVTWLGTMTDRILDDYKQRWRASDYYLFCKTASGCPCVYDGPESVVVTLPRRDTGTRTFHTNAGPCTVDISFTYTFTVRMRRGTCTPPKPQTVF